MSQRIKRQESPDLDAQDEDERMYAGLNASEEAEAFPNRPHNIHKTFLFSELFKSLFDPLLQLRKNPAGGHGPVSARTRGGGKLSIAEQKRHIIEKFIYRWRTEVGNDFYPAMRLMLPDKDRQRTVYGLKESNIGKLLVKMLKIDRNSEDGFNLLHWKLPGQTAAARMAGDFAGRCYEVISKRPMRMEVGDLTIADVNELLDRLVASSSESENLAVFQIFYRKMNPEEMLWIIRIVLKQMKIGTSENTLFHIWHPDAEGLFNVSSCIRRVCWDLWDPNFRLQKEATGLELGSPFQPQLAQFQLSTTFARMVDHLGVTEDDSEYWIEEKLDGERMQLHMIEDPSMPGGKRFFYCSRKAKNYSDLYGTSYSGPGLTSYLKNVFSPRVRNVILDGEMVAWNPEAKRWDPFGSLKTAANSLLGKVDDETKKTLIPVFCVFDILLLNDTQLGQYTLRDRYRALEGIIAPEPDRLRIHPHTVATDPDAVETELRKVIADGGEGLVLKNPRSMYRLNSRNDDWIKVKPDYMDEFGESLDCIIIGGFYGSGRRGGILSSYLCGLRVGENEIKAGANPEKCKSFFKVGGGFRVEDYATVKHHTEGKWKPWDNARPPTEYIQVGTGPGVEKPDVWIRPSESIVVSVKASSVHETRSFAYKKTLRFPRLRRLRLDRSWDSALSEDEFERLQEQIKEEQASNEMNFEERRKRGVKRLKRELVIAGVDATAPEFDGPKGKVFAGLKFCVLGDAARPIKKTKTQLETLIKEHGGKIVQRPQAKNGLVVVAEKKLVPVASLMKKGEATVVRPKWVVDCIKQPGGGFLLPYEEGHLFFAPEVVKDASREHTDMYGDSYAREVEVEELRLILKDIPKLERHHNPFNREEFVRQLEEHGHSLETLKGYMFNRCVVCLRGDDKSRNLVCKLGNYIKFGNGQVVDGLDHPELTHVVIVGEGASAVAREVRREIASRPRLPRIVTEKWIQESWKEKTLLDEERYAVV